MKTLKNWGMAALVIAAIVGGASMVELVSTQFGVVQAAVPFDNHWRWHDGRWSYWDQADGRWYYTDGVHWFFHDGNVWAPYRFDRGFGRKFERGAYRAPGEEVKIVVPNHKIHVAP